MDPNVSYTKTRLAPTPSGFLHLGNVLSFAITASLAQSANAKILLRIDDMDRERTNKLVVQDIFDTLNFMEIPWHEGPRNIQQYEQEYSQVHRTELYDKALQQLKEDKTVFACTCSRSLFHTGDGERIYPGTCRNRHIPYDAPGSCWRLYTDHEQKLDVKTWQGNVIHTMLPANMHDFILLRKDGLAAYQLTSVIDDIYYGVDLVVRGEDLWSSTLAQLYLASVLSLEDFGNTAFYHHRLLMNAAGEKLSKSAGDTSVQFLRKEGKTPAYIYTLIAGICGVTMPVSNYQELVSAIGTNLLSIQNKEAI